MAINTRLHLRPLRLLLCLALALLVSAACRKSGPKVIGPPFKGRLILYTERYHESNKIYEIKGDPATGKVDLNVIADKVEDFALSPDGNYLLYTEATRVARGRQRTV